MNPVCYYIIVYIDIQLELYQVNKCYEKKKKKEKEKAYKHEQRERFSGES